MRVSISFVEFDGFAALLFGRLRQALVLAGDPQVVAGVGIIGAEGDGPAKNLNGFVEILVLHQDDSQHGMGKGIVGGHADRLLEDLFGVLVFLLPGKDDAQVGEGVDGLGVFFEDLPVGGGSFVVFFLVEQGDGLFRRSLEFLGDAGFFGETFRPGGFFRRGAERRGAGRGGGFRSRQRGRGNFQHALLFLAQGHQRGAEHLHLGFERFRGDGQVPEFVQHQASGGLPSCLFLQLAVQDTAQHGVFLGQRGVRLAGGAGQLDLGSQVGDLFFVVLVGPGKFRGFGVRLRQLFFQGVHLAPQGGHLAGQIAPSRFFQAFLGGGELGAQRGVLLLERSHAGIPPGRRLILKAFLLCQSLLQIGFGLLEFRTGGFEFPGQLDDPLAEGGGIVRDGGKRGGRGLALGRGRRLAFGWGSGLRLGWGWSRHGRFRRGRYGGVFGGFQAGQLFVEVLDAVADDGRFPFGIFILQFFEAAQGGLILLPGLGDLAGLAELFPIVDHHVDLQVVVLGRDGSRQGRARCKDRCGEQQKELLIAVHRRGN